MVLKDVQSFEVKGGISTTLINSVARRIIYSKNYC